MRRYYQSAIMFLKYVEEVHFDWYKDEVKVYRHHLPVINTYKYDSKAMSHFGGDSVLTYNFINVMRNDSASVSPLDAGLLSALICLKARESALTGKFVEIKWE